MTRCVKDVSPMFLVDCNGVPHMAGASVPSCNDMTAAGADILASALAADKDYVDCSGTTIADGAALATCANLNTAVATEEAARVAGDAATLASALAADKDYVDCSGAAIADGAALATCADLTDAISNLPILPEDFLQFGSGAVSRSYRDKTAETVTPEDFGAVGDGIANDTAALQDAAATGKDVWLRNSYVITNTITLAAGQDWYGSGTVIHNATVPYGSYNSPSSNPAFNLTSAARLLHFTVQSSGEGVQMPANGAKVIGMTFDGRGTATKAGILAFADNLVIADNTVRNYGVWEGGVTEPAPYPSIICNGISVTRKVAASVNCVITGNYVHSCTGNGIFINGVIGVTIAHNRALANRLSGLQLAFLDPVLTDTSNVQVVGNNFSYNAADGMDISNLTGSAPIKEVNAKVIGNYAEANGWVFATAAAQLAQTGSKFYTVDGGSLTLFRVRGVTASGNVFKNNARPISYIQNCDNITITGNVGYKNFAHVLDDTDGFRVDTSTNVTITGNTITVPRSVVRLSGALSRVKVNDNNMAATNTSVNAVITTTGAGYTFDGNSVHIESGSFLPNGLAKLNNNKFTCTTSGSMFIADPRCVLSNNTIDLGSGTIQYSPAAVNNFYANDNTINSSGIAINCSNSSSTLYLGGNKITGAVTSAGMTVRYAQYV